MNNKMNIKINNSKNIKLIDEEREKSSLEREENIRKIEEDIKANSIAKDTNKGLFNKGKRKKDKSKIIESANPSTNAEYYRNYQVRLRNNRIKKSFFSFIFYSFIIVIVSFNVYFAFIKERDPIEDIAKEVRLQINQSSFPKEGVEFYLSNNLKSILSPKITFSSGTGSNDWNITNILLRKVVTSGDSNANIYFSAEISTNIGSSIHDFILPLGYIHEDRVYAPTGDLITRVENDEDRIELQKEKSRWSFGSAMKATREETEALTSFIDNFFTLLYNDRKDLSSMYTGPVSDIGDKNFKYEQINKVTYYKEFNPMSANCEVEYIVRSSEGLNYSIKTQMTIIQKNGLFEIKKIF